MCRVPAWGSQQQRGSRPLVRARACGPPSDRKGAAGPTRPPCELAGLGGIACAPRWRRRRSWGAGEGPRTPHAQQLGPQRNGYRGRLRQGCPRPAAVMGRAYGGGAHHTCGGAGRRRQLGRGAPALGQGDGGRGAPSGGAVAGIEAAIDVPSAVPAAAQVGVRGGGGGGAAARLGGARRARQRADCPTARPASHGHRGAPSLRSRRLARACLASRCFFVAPPR